VFILDEAPRYPTGFTAGLAITAVGGGVLIIVVLLMAWHNSRLAKSEQVGEERDEHNQENYRYLL
jgi:ATP-dependent Lon protease